ncbi:hypothetical protein NE237_022727 [Protea cynaroides]|uniref:Subtilisin-like protease SBT1.9 n=1 Tax=Protea cynaroides TaxID=273540 RepID=A0A9Q0HAZ1_9MAGN|nr:hypothetical protein NE237_022727 [Protea cynaroides]
MAIPSSSFYLFLILFNFSLLMTPLLAESYIFIVHMDLSVMPKAFSTHHSWFQATLSSASDISSSSFSTSSTSNLIYTYTNAINGFSALLSPSELETIKKSPGYVSSVQDMSVTMDTTHTSEFLGLNSYTGAWPSAKYGKDVIIGVIDTGIWPESESFKDEGMGDVPSRWKGKCVEGTQFNSSMCNKKLIGARYFNKGLLGKDPNITISMNSTRDTDGHGTHTASTAAGNYVAGASYFGYANGTACGMAPRAHVAIYKVIWEEGSSTSDYIAAIDQAISDGVDIISLSLSVKGTPLTSDPISIATFSAMEKGIFVSASAGNRGPDVRTISNGTPWLLTVAAGTVDRQFNGIITLGNGVVVTGSSLYARKRYLAQLPLVFMYACNSEKDLKKVRKKIVVCQDENDSLGVQVSYVRSANVAGAIFITNSSDIRSYMQSSFPVAFVSPQDGQTILDYIKGDSDPRASFEFRKTVLGTKPAPTVAIYSSRGPSPSCPIIMKPDVMAPGSLVLASWAKTSPVSDDGSVRLFNDFNVISGTSMATPHVAGVAALLKAAHPEWSPAAIRSAMMTTTDSVDNTLNPIIDPDDNNQSATPLDMGAGQINPNKALEPGLIYDINTDDYVRLLCALNYTMDQIKMITRSSANNCSKKSLDLNYPSFIAFFNSDDASSDAKIVQEFQRTVTTVRDGLSIYRAKLSVMDGIKVNVMPDKLVFRKKYEKLSYKLRIEAPKIVEYFLAHGALSWVEVGGKHVVRSPIVATSLSSEPLSE